MRKQQAGRFTVLVAVAAVLSLVTVALRGGVAEADGEAAPSGVSSNWLQTLNLYRGSSGLAPVSVNQALVGWAYNHARYMTCSGHFAHFEALGPMYTPEGNHAAHHSNIAAGPWGRTGRSWIEQWMAAPFHAINMLDPQLVQTGFAIAESPPGEICHPNNPWGATAVLDVQSVKNPNIPFAATTWPGPGARIPLQAFKGETPDPRTGCGGGPHPWQGLPMLGFFSSSASGVAMYLSGPQGPVPLCVVTAANYWNPDPGSVDVARSILGGRNAAIAIPMPVLTPGVYHLAGVNVAGEVLSSWFEILPEGS